MIRKFLERLGFARRPITAEDIHALWIARGGRITPEMRECVAAYKRNEEARSSQALGSQTEG